MRRRTNQRQPVPFVHGLIARAAAAVAAAKTRKKYLLVACTNPLTYYFLGDRSLKTFAAFVLPDLDGTVVVHDWCQNYDCFPGLIHQLCAQHILRDLADAAETYPGEHWPVQIREALQGLIHAANTAGRPGPDRDPDQDATPLIHAFRHGVLLALSQIPKIPSRTQQPCRDLLECLRDGQGDVLRFTTGLQIPPTANQAERDLRPAKTQQKISGRLRSQNATRDRCAIRGYISTAAKHGVSVLAAIRGALAGDPWMPPIPASP